MRRALGALRSAPPALGALIGAPLLPLLAGRISDAPARPAPVIDDWQGAPEHHLTRAFERVVEISSRGGSYEGIEATPGRAARALLEMTSGYDVDVAGLMTDFESDGYDEMVILRGVPFVSLCEHHLLPFEGQAHVAYIPSERIVGLSKIARVVEAYARRLQVQERLTIQIADAIEDHLAPVGVLVIVEAEHSCISCRGVRKPGVSAVTSALRGAIRDKPEARAEALMLIAR